MAQSFGDEGEGSGDAKVALDNLELIVLGDELHVEGTGDDQSLGDGTCDLMEQINCQRNLTFFKLF